MTKSQFIECAIRAGVVDAIAIEDAEAYDGGRTLHELSVMWTAVCEMLGNDPRPPVETEPRDRSIPAVIERLRFGDADGDDDDIAAAELSKPAYEREPPHCSTCECGAVEKAGFPIPAPEPRAPHERSTAELIAERDRINAALASRVLGDPRKGVTIGSAEE